MLQKTYRTTRDIVNIKKSIYRARHKILPALPKSAEEVHGSLLKRQIFTSRGEEFVVIIDAVGKLLYFLVQKI